MLNANIKLKSPKDFTIIRIVIESGHPFAWLNVYFTYRGRTYKAGFKDTTMNLNDFEDTDTAIRVYDERNAEWHHFITKAYIASVSGYDFDGKDTDAGTLTDYFNACFQAVEELTSNQPLA